VINDDGRNKTKGEKTMNRMEGEKKKQDSEGKRIQQRNVSDRLFIKSSWTSKLSKVSASSSSNDEL